MAAWMSDSKANFLLAAVQLNPEILSDDSAFLASIIQRAARFLTSQIHIDRYPELAAGYSQSGASPSEDISGAADNEILVSIDDGQFYTIELTLGSLTSGAAIAAEMQTQIRAVGVTSYKNATVTFAGGLYTITSPTFGEFSNVTVSYNTEREDIAIALKLSPDFGGTEWAGGSALPEYDDMVVAIVQGMYNKVGVEGMKSWSTPGSGSFTAHDMDPMVMAFITDNRRLVG